MATSPYNNIPRRVFLGTIILLGVSMIVIVICLIFMRLANGQTLPLSKGEKSIRAVGRAYVNLGYFELKEFYLVSTNNPSGQAKLHKQLDSLWSNLQKEIKTYQKFTVLEKKSTDSLYSSLKKYRQNSIQIKKLVADKKNDEALNNLLSTHHRFLLKKLEEQFQDIIELLPDQTKVLLTPEKKAYQSGEVVFRKIKLYILVISVVLLLFIQSYFDDIPRRLLIRRVLPLLIITNVVIQAMWWYKPVPRYNAKYQLVKDYTRFINFMSFFNHYTALECRHVYDSSLLVKKQLEEEMAVYRRSVRQALRDSRKKFDGLFKKDVSELRDLRNEYFSKIAIPSLVLSFQQSRFEALDLLLPTAHRPDTLADLLSPEMLRYTSGQNAIYIKKIHTGFDKILRGLDKYYQKAPQKLYQTSSKQSLYWLFLGGWLLLCVFTLFRFYKAKKWKVYKAKEHFLPKNKLI